MKIIKKIKRKIVRNLFGENIQIGGLDIYLGKKHNLPNVLDVYPEYGLNLVRIARCVARKYNDLLIIDIGANVGDSIAMLLADNNKYEVVAIEGDPYYFSVLKKNFSRFQNIILHMIFFGENNNKVTFAPSRNEGTLKIDQTKISAKETTLVSLDTFIKENQDYRRTKLVKIDTDGYDNKIIRGGKNFFITESPVIFFEYDSKLLFDNNERGVDIFDMLSECGYSSILFYDNYGRFLLSTTLENKQLIFDLHRYTTERKGAFPYYDIVLFHEKDNDLAGLFLAEERR